MSLSVKEILNIGKRHLEEAQIADHGDRLQTALLLSDEYYKRTADFGIPENSSRPSLR